MTVIRFDLNNYIWFKRNKTLLERVIYTRVAHKMVNWKIKYICLNNSKYRNNNFFIVQFILIVMRFMIRINLFMKLWFISEPLTITSVYYKMICAKSIVAPLKTIIPLNTKYVKFSDIFLIETMCSIFTFEITNKKD